MEVVHLKAKTHGNLYHNPDNQLQRALGDFEDIYIGGATGGTVRRVTDGKCFDWWPTEESIPNTPFRVIKIVPAE